MATSSTGVNRSRRLRADGDGWALLGGRLCEHCTLAGTLARLLDDGTGRIASNFLPLVKILLEMDRPKSRLIRLRNPNVVRLLRGLATGSIPLTHDGLHQETPWRTVTHLRGTCEQCSRPVDRPREDAEGVPSRMIL
ncbi:hypothetical protein [Streptomyces sp. NPDC059169]|uniref:hypothetical protein n=1 Tax=unclassified Streptomyces TaxID=2593676 RepID=UPI0036B4E53E